MRELPGAAAFWRFSASVRHVRLAAFAAATVLIAACESPTLPPDEIAEPYDFTLEGTNLVLRWPVGATLAVFPVPVPQQPARTEMLRESLEHGARAWNDVARDDEYHITVAPSVEAADVVLGWSDVPLPVDTAGCEPGPGGRAVTSFCLHPADTTRLRPYPILSPDGPVFGRPRMVIVIRSSQAGNAEQVRELVAHELGHALGIGRHSSNPADLMYAAELATAVPSPADAATVRFLYRITPDILPH